MCCYKILWSFSQIYWIMMWWIVLQVGVLHFLWLNSSSSLPSPGGFTVTVPNQCCGTLLADLLQKDFPRCSCWWYASCLDAFLSDVEVVKVLTHRYMHQWFSAIPSFFVPGVLWQKLLNFTWKSSTCDESKSR